jgi:hypothetical protein
MPQPKQPGTARKRATTTRKATPRTAAWVREEASEASLRDSLLALRDTLTRGIILTRERIA